MAHNSRVTSISQASDDANSSDHSPRSFATVPDGGAIGQPSLSNQFNNNNNDNSNVPPPSDTTSNYYLPQRENNMNYNQPQQGLETRSKRPRGRPSGSKNKPKSPVIIRQESENALRSVVIEIPIGKDVIEGLINFARQHRVDISVLSGSGSVTDITLRHHVSCASIFPIHGTFPILSLTGSYIGVCFPSLATPNHASFPPCSSFGISVAGPQGQVFGGVIGGRVMAASVVYVMAVVFKKPEFHRLSLMNENVVDEVGQMNRQMHAANLNMLQWNNLNHQQ
ncbi:unnamed protein product [Lupinus luteus]|uniref:PPC domain-containing protein n=1 Tax=Lupinus luteus TaxID=3873 RepID=A0AAV1WDP7_LUPLU